MAFVTAIGDIFPLVTAITDTNVSNGCDNGAVRNGIRLLFLRLLKYNRLISTSKSDRFVIKPNKFYNMFLTLHFIS